MIKTFAAAFAGTVMLASQAFAWSETQQSNNGMAIWAYPSKENYCPAGLQPVVVGGVICCGTPTHHGYQSHPAPRAKTKPAASYVSYGKGANETVVYEKGQ